MKFSKVRFQIMEWRMHGFNREWDAKVELRMLKFIAGIRLR